jgi:hypothetical protein
MCTRPSSRQRVLRTRTDRSRFVRAHDPAVRTGQQNRGAESVVRRKYMERPDQREGRCPRVFGEAYPVSCSRYRCPIHRAWTAARRRDMRESADCRPGIDVNFQPIHADAEVRLPVVRCGPPVPDRVLASGFSGRGLIGRVHVRADDPAVRAGQQNRGGESVVRRRQRWRGRRCWCGRRWLRTIPPAGFQND